MKLTPRLLWHPQLTLVPGVGAGSDEWHNRSVWITLPLIGHVVVFHGRTVDRSGWYQLAEHGGCVTFVAPDEARMAHIPRRRLVAAGAPECPHAGDASIFLPLPGAAAVALADRVEEIGE